MHAGSTFLRHRGKVEFISNLLSVVFIRSFSVRCDIFKCLYSKIRLAFQNWIYLRWWNRRITFRKCVILLIFMFCFIFQPRPVWLLTLLQLKLGWSKRAYLRRFSVGSPSKSIHSHSAEFFLKVAQVWSFLQLSEHGRASLRTSEWLLLLMRLTAVGSIKSSLCSQWQPPSRCVYLVLERTGTAKSEEGKTKAEGQRNPFLKTTSCGPVCGSSSVVWLCWQVDWKINLFIT